MHRERPLCIFPTESTAGFMLPPAARASHDKLKFVGQLEFEIKPVIKYKLLPSGLPNLEAQL
jgi:hypothetical protein